MYVAGNTNKSSYQFSLADKLSFNDDDTHIILNAHVWNT